MAQSATKAFYIICGPPSFAPTQNVRKVLSINKIGQFVSANEKSIQNLPMNIQSNLQDFAYWLVEMSCTDDPNIMQNLSQIGAVVTQEKQGTKIKLNQSQLMSLFESWQPVSQNNGQTGQGTIMVEDLEIDGVTFNDLDDETRENILFLSQADIDTVRALCSVDKRFAEICKRNYTITHESGTKHTFPGLLPYLKHFALRDSANEVAEAFVLDYIIDKEAFLTYFTQVDADINKTFTPTPSVLRSWKPTILTLAIDANRPDIVEELIKLGADVNQYFVGKQTPLEYAATTRNLNTVEKLIAAGGKIHRSSFLKQPQIMASKAYQMITEADAFFQD